MKTTSMSVIFILLAGTALAEGFGATSSSGGSAGATGSASAVTATGSGGSETGDPDFEATARSTGDAAPDIEAGVLGTEALDATGIDPALPEIDAVAGADVDAGSLETDVVADTVVDETPLIDSDETGLLDDGLGLGAGPLGAELELDLEGEATMTEFGSTVVDTGEGEALLLEPSAPVVIAPPTALEEDEEPMNEILDGVGGDVQPRRVEVE